MNIIETQDISRVLPLHKDIFGTDFPIDSYQKKSKANKVYIFLYIEKEKTIGYSIIVDQQDILNYYAWYGGVLPEYQGNGITVAFFDYLVQFAKKNNYASISLASNNYRPHMIRLAVKIGFDIVGLKIRTEGDGSKIYFQYRLLPSCQKIISLVKDGRMIKPSEIERLIVVAFKENADTIFFQGKYDAKLLRFIIKYCDSFIRKPKLVFHNNSFCTEDLALSQLVTSYHGDILFSEDEAF